MTGGKSTSLITVMLLAFSLTGCDQRMDDQPKYEALEDAPMFTDRQAARQPPFGTVPTDALPSAAAALPNPLTLVDIERGRERFEIYCLPCHGVLGQADGPVVQRGFPAPPSYHIARLRQANIEHFYNVISHGYGIMYSYADRVKPADRWRIAFYIRALQQSQDTDLEQYPQFRAAVEVARPIDKESR